MKEALIIISALALALFIFTLFACVRVGARADKKHKEMEKHKNDKS